MKKVKDFSPEEETRLVRKHLRAINEGRWKGVDEDFFHYCLLNIRDADAYKIERLFITFLKNHMKITLQPNHNHKTKKLLIKLASKEILQIIKEQPSLRSHVRKAVPYAYRFARLEAANETDIDIRKIPAKLTINLAVQIHNLLMTPRH